MLAWGSNRQGHRRSFLRTSNRSPSLQEMMSASILKRRSARSSGLPLSLFRNSPNRLRRSSSAASCRAFCVKLKGEAILTLALWTNLLSQGMSHKVTASNLKMRQLKAVREWSRRHIGSQTLICGMWIGTRRPISCFDIGHLPYYGAFKRITQNIMNHHWGLCIHGQCLLSCPNRTTPLIFRSIVRSRSRLPSICPLLWSWSGWGWPLWFHPFCH